MNATALIETYALGPVLVFGSLPPHNRDLDLLVRPPEQEVLVRALLSAGFVNHEVEWARFEGCGVSVVDLVPVGNWDLPEAEVDAVWGDAAPINGFANLIQPSPHHSLLILARRMIRSGVLDNKRRARIRVALDRDAGAWDQARKHAPAWAAERALQLLESTYKSGIPPLRPARARALADRLAATDAMPAVAYAKAFRSTRARPRRRAVVTLSGLDGSGKSAQAEALRATLERLGYDAVVVWNRLSYNPSLNWIALPFKRLLFALRSRAHTATNSPPNVRRAGKQFRQDSPLVTSVWAGIVALANGLTQRRIIGHHLRRGAIVVCDRYILDSAVHLRYRYGADRPFAWQKRLVRLLSPPPTLAFYLDVSPETAFGRKAEQYDLAQLELQSRLYRQEHEALGTIKLDGLLSKEALCEEIARAVWSSLHLSNDG